MIGEGKKKMCVSKDVQSTKGGSFSCSTCGASSEDKSVLCDPKQNFEDEPFSG